MDLLSDEPPHYGLWFRLDRWDRFLAWFSLDDRDGVLTSGDGTMLVFADQGEVRRYCEAHGHTFVDEAPILHDLDLVEAWIRSPEGPSLDPGVALDAWNLFTDLRDSGCADPAGFTDLIARNRGVYDRVFARCSVGDIVRGRFGADAAPLTVPDAAEERALRGVLRAGMTMFRGALGPPRA